MNDISARLHQAGAHRTPTGRVGIGKAHGKVILLGEHSVVYGRPAIAVPVPDLMVTARVAVAPGHETTELSAHGPAAPRQRPDAQSVTDLALLAACDHFDVPMDPLEVTVDSSVPEGRGLGSSAAIAGAVIRAVADLHGRPLSPDDTFDLVGRSESFAHGRASGVDARSVLWPSGPLWFENGTSRALPVSAVGCGVLVIADTGRAGSTREAVQNVGRYLDGLGEGAAKVLDRLGALTSAAADDLAAGDLTALGERMTAAQEALSGLGVSSPEIDTLVDAARDAGALGAKLTGGGLGGCIIALARDDVDARRLRGALTTAGAVQTISVGLA